MEKNSKLQAVEALDVSVLLKRLSSAEAFELVINLIKTSYDVEVSIQDYLDYLWGESANDDPWEKEVNKHSPHRRAICNLQKKLLSFIMQNVWANKDIPQLAGSFNPIDIKSLVYEMNEHEGVKLLNTLIKKAEYEIGYIEWRNIHGEGFSEEIRSDCESLAELKDKMQAIVNEQKRLIREWQDGVDKLEEEIARGNDEMIECVNQRESELQVPSTTENTKEVVATVSIADI